MQRIERDRAILLGLAALQDIVDAAHDAPVPGDVRMRALLALMFALSNGTRFGYVDFWRAVQKPLDPDAHPEPQHYIRHTNLNTAVCAITLSLGLTTADKRIKEAIERTKSKRDCGRL